MKEEKEEIIRVRLPERDEIFGMVTARVGATRFVVTCADGKERTCRIPGRIKREIWVREGDVVLVVPWPVEREKRGDIIWRYTPTEVDWLKERGYLKDLF